MPITFADIPLTPTTAAHDAAARWWHEHRLDQFDYPGFVTPLIQNLPIPSPPMREPPRFGVLRWPVGASQWATFHICVPRAQILAIRAAVGTEPQAFPLVLTDGQGNEITVDMYLLNQQPISDRGDGFEYGMVTFVDQRFFWWQTGGTAVPTTAASWNSLLTQLIAQLPGEVASTIDTIPPAYLTPNMSRWSIGVQPIPLMIDAVCMTIGMRCLVRLDGTLVIQTSDTAEEEDIVRWISAFPQCLAGGQFKKSDIAQGMPYSVDTVFFDGTSVNNTLASLANPNLEGVTGVPNAVARVTADPAAPTGPEKTAYATQAATDYYNWGLALTDADLRGFVGTPCALDEAIEWIHVDTGLITRILRPVWSDRNVYGDPPSGALHSAQVALPATRSVGATWADIDAAYAVTLPVAGRYIVYAGITGTCAASVDGVTGTVNARLGWSLGGGWIPQSVIVVCSSYSNTKATAQSVYVQVLVQVDAPIKITVQGITLGTSANFLGGVGADSSPNSYIGYIQLS